MKLTWIALGLIGGVALARVVPMVTWVSALALVMTVEWKWKWVAGAVAAGAIVATCRGTEIVQLKGVDDRAIDVVDGTVRGPVARRGALWSARVETASGAVWLRTPTKIRPGDRIAGEGRLKAPRGFRNPGAFDRMRLAERRRIDREVSAPVVVVGVDDEWPWRWADGVRSAWSARIDGSRAGAIARGAVVGDRGDIDDDTDADWRAAGVYHVLSVSGLHLAVVALLGFAVVKRAIVGLGLGLGRPPATWAAVPALAMAIAYTLITGAETATVRALIVVGLGIAGAALGRRARLADALAVAAIMIVIHKPAAVGDPSFQLSFVAASVLAAMPRRGGMIRRAFAATVWVTLATAPITAATFGEVAWGGVVGNLIVMPLVELVAIPAVLIGLVASDWLIELGVAVIGIADSIVQVIAPITPTIAVAIDPVDAGLWLVAWLALFVAWRDRWRFGIVIAVVVASVAVFEWREDDLVIAFLDVGQGDAAVIELPDGQTWIVDAGDAEVARYLAYRGRDRIDLAIVSHPHPDHYAGLLEIPIDEVWVAAPDAAWGDTVAALRRRGTRIVAPPIGVARIAGGVTLEVLAPKYHPEDGEALVAAPDPVRSVNDNSLVVAVEYRGTTVLFLGDLEAEGEAALGSVAADIVKVAHHGSRTSSSVELVQGTGADVAVVSVGRANRYGLPNVEVIERWRRAGARVLRTDEVGAVTVTIGDRGVRVFTYDP